MIKKIFIFLALACCFSVPAFAADVAPLAIYGDYNSYDYWNGLNDLSSVSSLPPGFGDYKYNVVFRNSYGNLVWFGSNSSVWAKGTLVRIDSVGNLTIDGDDGNDCVYYGFPKSSDGWQDRTGGNTYIVLDSVNSSSSVCDAKILYLDFDLHDAASGNVFFSPPLTQSVAILQEETLPALLIPYLEDSLGSLVPFGIGLLASLAALVTLPKVLRKFLA